jgi:hypothetical protein
VTMSSQTSTESNITWGFLLSHLVNNWVDEVLDVKLPEKKYVYIHVMIEHTDW